MGKKGRVAGYFTSTRSKLNWVCSLWSNSMSLKNLWSIYRPRLMLTVELPICRLSMRWWCWKNCHCHGWLWNFCSWETRTECDFNPKDDNLAWVLDLKKMNYIIFKWITSLISCIGYNLWKILHICTFSLYILKITWSTFTLGTWK